MPPDNDHGPLTVTSWTPVGDPDPHTSGMAKVCRPLPWTLTPDPWTLTPGP